MKTVYKISIAAIVLLNLAIVPAAAQFGCGLGGCGLGAGFGGYGLGGACSPCGGVSVGEPQNCIAQISCNVPVTTNVPVMSCTTVPQQVPITVPVTDICPVTVPKVCVVPQTIGVPVVKPALSSTTVPVTVPVQTCVPVTNMVPQCYTVPMSGMGGACGTC